MVNDISYNWIQYGQKTSAEAPSIMIASAIGAREIQDGAYWLQKGADGEIAMTRTGTLELDQWYHIKMIYTENKTTRYYVNDAFICETPVYNTRNTINALRFYTSSYRASIMYIDDIEIRPYYSFSQDFEKDTADYVVYDEAGTVELVNENGNHYLMLKDETGGEDYSSSNRVYIQCKPIAAPLQITYRIKYDRDSFSKDNHDISYDWVRFGTGSAVNKSIKVAGGLAPSENGTKVRWAIPSTDGEGLSTSEEDLKINSWYDIKIIYTKEKMLDYYVNGRHIASLESSVDTDYINLLQLYTSNKRCSTMYIDDIEVRPYEKPWVSERMDYAKRLMDSVNEGILNWLPNMYDKEEGGFYYAQSSKDTERFRPDIESTGQAISYMDLNKMLGYMPESIKLKLISYFQSRQDPDTGYFLDPQNIDTTNDRQKARNISYSVSSLSKLGSTPLYALPSERIAQQEQMRISSAYNLKFTMADGISKSISSIDNLPDYMQSPERYRQWIEEELNWARDPWTAGDRLSSSATYLKGLDSEMAENYWRTALEWLYENQNPETGMWGGEKTSFEYTASGVFKVILYLRDMPDSIKGESNWFPNVDKYFETVLANINSYSPTKIFFPRNILDSVGYLQEQIDPEKFNLHIEDIVIHTVEALMLFREPDGGVSAEIGKSSVSTGGGFELSLGLPESDVNAAASFHASYRMFYKYGGYQMMPYTKDLAIQFFERIK